MGNANILSIWKVSTLALCMGLVAGQSIAQATDDTAATDDALQKAHSIEAKVYRIPKDGEKWLGVDDFGGNMELDYGAAGSFILPKPASLKSCMESFGCDLRSGSPGFAYKVGGDLLADKFLPALEKMGGKLLSAPRVTTSLVDPFKIIWFNSDSSTGKLSRRSGGQPTSSSLADDLFSKLKDLGLSPVVVKLANDELGSTALVADLRSPEYKSKFRGLVFSYAVKPESGDGNAQLNVATHYRVADHKMKRKWVFGRKKPVHAGIAELQARYEESMAPGDVLAFFQRLPHSGDTLLTLLTVKEVTRHSPDA
jgi:hypothetical protein